MISKEEFTKVLNDLAIMGVDKEYQELVLSSQEYQTILNEFNKKEQRIKELEAYCEILLSDSKTKQKLNAIREIVEDISTYNIYPHKQITSGIIQDYMKRLIKVLDE